MILAVTMNPSLDKVYAVDDYAIGKVFRPKAMTATAGGKGLNVARVACLLGEKVIATGFLGGSTGAFIAQEVEKQGIEGCFIEIDGETRTCINVVDEKNNTSTEILEPGPEVTPTDCAKFLNLFDTLLDRCTVVTASGSLPRGVPVDFYRDLIKRTNLKGKKFILDTSGRYFTEGIKEKPYMIKPNQDEAKSIGNGISRPDDYIRLLLSFKEKGISFPVITLGQEGCLAAFTDKVYRFFSPPLKVINAVGSGDAFVAGCAVAINRGFDPLDTVKLGMACGMANTQFFKTGMISTDLVEKFLDEVRYERFVSGKQQWA